MKALLVIGLLALMASIVAVRADQVPMPSPVRQYEQVVTRSVNENLYGQDRLTSLMRHLDLPRGTFINSLLLIASSNDGRGLVKVLHEGRILTERFLGSRLETIQVQVNAELNDRREFALQTSGNVFLAVVGATFISYADSNPVPTPVDAVCELYGFGAYNGYNWNFRVATSGTVMEGADSLEAALQKLRKLAEARLCSFGHEQRLELHGFGAYRGYNWNYRVELGRSGVIEGSDNLESALQIAAHLERAGLGRPEANQRCGVLPAGAYRGYNWKHRVTIGERIVDGTDNFDVAVQKMNVLRNARFCY